MSHPNGRVDDAETAKARSSSTSESNKDDRSILQKFSEVLIGGLEHQFGRLGYLIGAHPWKVIIISIFLSSLTGLGLLSFKEEIKPEKLWVPKDSKVIDNKEWIDDNFPSTVVREQFIAEAPNILLAVQIKALNSIYKKSFTLQTSSGIRLTDVCVKSGTQCKVRSILEVWSYDDATINALTDSKILQDINNTTISPVTNKEIVYANFLGKISYSNGDIASAKAAIITWENEGNDTMEDRTESWESKFIDMGKQGHSAFTNSYVWAGKSYDEEADKAINSDISSLTAGYIIVIIFVTCVLGNYNFMEQRIWLTLGGFVCIGLSILISIGLSSAFQQVYGPIQSILPFLLLGIGVDDMFVIVGALQNLPPEESGPCDIPELMQKVLAHAGVSITVTSITDFVAFIIGATTIIPALRSFCVYAALGILGLYILQATLFTACLAIDVRRIRNRRDGCLCCIKHGDNYEVNKCSQKQMVAYVFKKGLAQVITLWPVRIIAIVSGLALFGVNVWGFTNLKQYFDPNWFLPSDSYAAKYRDAEEIFFPTAGALGHVYCGDLPYYNLRTKFDNLNSLMTSSQYIRNGSTDSWFEELTTWLNGTTDGTILPLLDNIGYPSSEQNFVNLTYRLVTEQATRLASDVRLVASPNLDIKSSRFVFVHTPVDDSADTEIKTMDSAYDMVRDAGFTSDECFPFAYLYMEWETNKIIKDELYQNLGMAMACVFVVGLILIANFVTTVLVFIGVIFTLVDVAGTMHFWDLTIETVTSVVLILAIGLAVDYSAHIGHMFMRVRGTREERVKETIREIGPPVFFGGFSTFLAFVLLADSNSYVFRTFFKVNFLVVLYGLFHGLIFLPALLSIIGPDPYPNATLVLKNHRKMSVAVPGTNGGVDNSGFEDENKRGSEMTQVANLPPLNKPLEQSNGGVSHNGGSDYRVDSPRPENNSARESPPPEYNAINADNPNTGTTPGAENPSTSPDAENPNVTVIRM